MIGKTTDTLRFVVRHGGEVKVDLPIKELGDEAPLYDRPHVPDAETAKSSMPHRSRRRLPIGAALKKLVACPDLASKRWVWEQYDHLILGNTVSAPGGDAAVVRSAMAPRA